MKYLINRKSIVLTFFVLISITLSANSTFGANVKQNMKDNNINYTAKNKTVAQVFTDLSNITGCNFFYEDSQLEENNQLNLHIKSGTLTDVLSEITKQTGLIFKKTDNTVSVSRVQGSEKTTAVLQDDQKTTIFGVVYDSDGEPIPGVSIIIKGTTTGIISDIDGKYSIQIPNKETILVYTFIGGVSQEIRVGNRTVINVTMKEDDILLREVAVVGYGTQKKGNITGAVVSINADDLVTTPVSNTSNALAGKLPGLIALQPSGKPGDDQSVLNIRGFGDGALVIVDGIETPFNTLDPNQIASISVLKDGSASIYGARAGNGVILVTTKRGTVQKPTVTLNSSFTFQGITSMPKASSAGQYAEMAREKHLHGGNPETNAPFTEEQIRKYYDGSDPQYPNTNWYDELIRSWSPQQQHNLSIRGGSEKIKYYGFLGYMNQESLWKKNGGEYSRYNLQSNIDAQVTNDISIQIDLAAMFNKSIFSIRPSGNGDNTVWQDYWNTLPIYPASLPDPTKLSYADGQGTGGVHISSNYDRYGTNKNYTQELKGTGVINYTVRAVEGLSAKFFANYKRWYAQRKEFNKPTEYYTYDIESETYTLKGSTGSAAQLKARNDMGSMFTTQLSLNYDRVFAIDHHITALALIEGIDTDSEWISAGRDEYLSSTIEQLFAGNLETAKNDGRASEMGRMSYVGRLNYAYKGKYLLETALRADASAKFRSNKRWGYFPSVSLGWRISEESFMQNITSVFDDLKLRASYGSSGNDNVGEFQYLAGYRIDGNYLLGGKVNQGIISTGLANPLLTWESIKIYNLGLNWSLWNRKLYGEAEVFYRTRSGIPGKRTATVSSTFGASLPDENINSLNDRGFEFSVGTSQTFGDWKLDVNGNIAWSRAKWDHLEQEEYTDEDEIRINKGSGRWTDRQFGYISNGLFTSQEEINALEFDQDGRGNTSLSPGDIRYVDRNKDGKLDWRDQEEIGKGTRPHWTTGININIRYKNFDFSTLFQGAFGYYADVIMTRSYLLYSEEVYKLRWTEENNNRNALVPRLGGSSTNNLTSDYRYKSANYLRLKTLAIGYNFSPTLLSKLNIGQARVYVSGTNLLTFDKLKKYGIDPEAPTGLAGMYYPQMRTISMGVNLSF